MPAIGGPAAIIFRMKDIVIVAGKRTPMGEYGGALKRFHGAWNLARLLRKLLLTNPKFDSRQLRSLQSSGMLSRPVVTPLWGASRGAQAGLPVEVPALTVNRLCGSGIQSIISAAQLIELGEAAVVLAGGMESMSQAPHVIRGARWGLRLGQGKLEDSLMVALLDTYCGCYMAATAENLARKYGITRETSGRIRTAKSETRRGGMGQRKVQR